MDIKPVHINTFNCFEDMYVSIAEWLKCGYIFAFTECWGFSYSKKEGSKIEECISLNRENIFKNLELYHGLSIKKEEETSY